MNGAYSAKKQRGRPFLPGQSGNPAGKPKGTRNHATVAAEALLDGEAQALTRKAIELALSGDTTALRLCIERLIPPRKERTFQLDLCPINCAGDAADAASLVLDAVVTGQITTAEASAVMDLIEARKQALGVSASPVPSIQVAFTAPIPKN